MFANGLGHFLLEPLNCGHMMKAVGEVSMLANSRFERGSDEMRDAIWIVISAGGSSREKETADEYNAEACRSLANHRVDSNADIVSAKRFTQARSRLQGGERIALHQGGGKRWRKGGYAAGMLIAAGFFEGSQVLEDNDRGTYAGLCRLTRQYFPIIQFKGVLIYRLYRAERPLPIEDIGMRPMPGNNFIPIERNHPDYVRLDTWWGDNVPPRYQQP